MDRARGGNGIDFEYEHRLLMPDHSVKYVSMVCEGIRDQDGQLEYIAAVQDVTQRRLSEEALAKARSELARVARVTSLGALTASIAHEVNQPLSGIITNASTCLRMLAADPPNVDGARETARRTIRDGNRASDVITRLRALFSKKDTTTEAVDLNEATREVIALSAKRASEKPGDFAGGTWRRPPAGHGRSRPASAGHPEPAPERFGRDERNRRSSEDIDHQEPRPRRRRSCAPDRAGCGGRFRPSSRGPSLRCVLHNQERRHGNRTVRQPLHHRKSSWTPMGGA